MRFKRLRLFIAISLVLFIFIVGGIIALGFLQNNAQNNAGSNADLKTLTPVYYNNDPTQQTNTQTQPTVVTPTQPTPSTTTNTVVHRRIITSAS